MIPLLDGARRKHITHNFTSGVFLEKSMTRYSKCRKRETTKENPPIFSTIVHFLYLFTNFTVTKHYNMAGHARPYPGTWGLLGLRSTG
jgi:hypothetical protein